MPYEFYTVARTVFFGALLLMFVRRFASKQQPSGKQLIVGAVFLILYNPVFQVHLGSKELWLIVNVLTLFLLASLFTEPSDTETKATLKTE